MTESKKIEMIPLADIIPDADQPRRDFDASKLAALAASIKKHGVLNPVKVQKVGSKYKLVDGERRYRAALSLKMRDLPAIVSAPMSATETIIEQFQLQELHEGWSPTEKAVAAGRLARELKLSVPELGKALNIPEKTVFTWLAFFELGNRSLFVKHNIPIAMAKDIRGLKNTAKKVYEQATGDEFTKEMSNKLEVDTIKSIVSGDIAKSGDFMKLRDAIITDHKNIERIGKATPGKLFLGSKAQAAFHYRNTSNHCSYLMTHLKGGEASKGYEGYFKDDPEAVGRLKRAHKALGDLIARVS